MTMRYFGLGIALAALFLAAGILIKNKRDPAAATEAKATFLSGNSERETYLVEVDGVNFSERPDLWDRGIKQAAKGRAYDTQPVLALGGRHLLFINVHVRSLLP